MSSKSNQVFLNQIFDEAVNFISDALSNPPAVLKNNCSSPQSINYCQTTGDTNSIGNCTITTTVGSTTTTLGYSNYVPFYGWNVLTPIIYQPVIWVDALRDFTPSCSKDNSHPVTNFSVDKDSNFLIEIACTGFEQDELTVERKDLKIIVEGKRKNKETSEDRKYFYRNIATRDFSKEFSGSEKWCFDKLSVSYKDGLLAISIPLKEEFQPVRQKYEIK